MKKYLIVILLMIILIGCEDYKEVNINIGKLIKAEAITTSFNEKPKMLLETEKGYFVVWGYGNYIKGKDVIIDKRKLCNQENTQ